MAAVPPVEPQPPTDGASAPLAPEALIAQHFALTAARRPLLARIGEGIRQWQGDAAAWLPALRDSIRRLEEFIDLYPGEPWIPQAREALADLRADLRQAVRLAGPLA